MGWRWRRGLIGLAAGGLLGLDAGSAWAQVGRTAASATAPGSVLGSPLVNPYANPFANPAMNPYLNQAMTQQRMGRSDLMLYFMAAQQARKGAAVGAGAGAAGQVPDQFVPNQPVPNSPVPGQFDSYSPGNAGRSRLSTRFPAYGRAAVNARTTARMSPTNSPAPNTGLSRYFDRRPATGGYPGR